MTAFKRSVSLPLFIGWRYTFSRREQRFISFVSLISLLGLILGITAMLVVLSAMNGFDRELKLRILKVIPHGFIEAPDGFAEAGVENWQAFAQELRQHSGIEAVAPVITGKGLISFNGKSIAVELNGVLPASLDEVSDVSKSLIAGELADLDENSFGIILGQVLARRLGVSTGDRVQIVLPQIQVTPAGLFTRQKTFTVVGIFSVGADPDSRLGLIHLNSAARFFQKLQADKTPRVTQLQIKTNRIEEADTILQSLRLAMTNKSLTITSWADTHRTLFNAIKMEKRMISLLLFVVIAVAVFNISSILVMMVAEKRKDIAILRVMGADTPTISRIFITQGLLVGVIGIVVGTVLGSLLALHLSDFFAWLENTLGARLFSPDVYYIAQLPSDWRLWDAFTIMAVSLVLCVLATLYPAWKSGQLDPVQSLNE